MPYPVNIQSHEFESLAETEAFGERLAEAIAGVVRKNGKPFILGLSGDLGAGKSTLTRAMGRTLGVEGAMPSPTFTLERRYDLPGDLGELRHWDFYRLDEMSDLAELGFYDTGSHDLIIVEWVERRPEVFGDESNEWNMGWLQMVNIAPGEAEDPASAPRKAHWKTISSELIKALYGHV